MKEIMHHKEKSFPSSKTQSHMYSDLTDKRIQNSYFEKTHTRKLRKFSEVRNKIYEQNKSFTRKNQKNFGAEEFSE